MTADPIASSASRSRSGASRAGWFFWLFLVFGLLCLAAGWWLGRETPRLLGTQERAPARRAAPAPRALPPNAAAQGLTGPVVAVDTLGQEGSGLAARVSRLEAEQARTARAAAASLAAASLSEAAQSPAGFSDAVLAAGRVLPASEDLNALRRLAPTGAPTRAALLASYPEAAARAAAAARAPGDRSGLLASVSGALARLVSVRRTGDVRGSGPDALLARAEARLETGDFDGALDQLAALPPPSRDAMARWLNQAERRAAIDRHIAAVRMRALNDLAAVAGHQPVDGPPA